VRSPARRKIAAIDTMYSASARRGVAQDVAVARSLVDAQPSCLIQRQQHLHRVYPLFTNKRAIVFARLL